jgi:hypothetical protein
MVGRLRADPEQKQDFGGVTITQGLDTHRPITEALQLRFCLTSESMGHHDSEIMDGERVG